MVGEAEIIVTTEADDWAPVEVVADAVALRDLGWRPGEAGACLLVELGLETAVERG